MKHFDRVFTILAFVVPALATSTGFAALTCRQVFTGTPAAWGYHASPELSLSVLDPAYSRNTSRYGPGVYLYASELAVKDHALSINEGRIKYDKTARPARVYKVRVSMKRALDMTEIYQAKELEYILSPLPKTSRKLVLKDLPEVSGQEFYDRLTSYFAASMTIALDRGTVGGATPKTKVNALLKAAGIEVLVGQIPVPQSSRFEKAYISLMSIPIQP